MTKGRRTKVQVSTKHSTENYRLSNTQLTTKHGMNSDAPEWYVVHAPPVTFVVLQLNYTNIV